MKFDVQRAGLEEKTKELEGLMKVLHDLERAEDRLKVEPAKRAMLPYEGPRTIRSPEWKDH